MNEKYKQDFIKAGNIARQVRSFGKSLIVKGASYNDVITKINHKIVELGGRAAFPPQIALNYVAAHFLPEPGQDITFEDQVIKLDIGVCYNGAIGDCAVTIDLSGKYQPLVDAAEAALLAAEKIIKVGTPVTLIGKIIEETITSLGYSPVRNLSGHGLGYYKIHTSPAIPNYNDGSKVLIKPGMTFAIEPFATNGKGSIVESGNATIFSLIKSSSVQNPKTRFILDKIKEYSGLPFAIHDFTGKNHTIMDVKNAFQELQNLGVISGYPPLIENVHCMVAQAENSVLVDKEGKVFITTR